METRNLSGQTKKVIQPLWTKKFTQPPEDKKITEPLRTKKITQPLGLQRSQMVLNGLKKINHKFNRMAFVTRFNRGLVWSKRVQILTKKSSKWVGHNQVSWSSLVLSATHVLFLVSAVKSTYLFAKKYLELVNLYHKCII